MIFPKKIKRAQLKIFYINTREIGANLEGNIWNQTVWNDFWRLDKFGPFTNCYSIILWLSQNRVQDTPPWIRAGWSYYDFWQEFANPCQILNGFWKEKKVKNCQFDHTFGILFVLWSFAFFLIFTYFSQNWPLNWIYLIENVCLEKSQTN